jgi:hypothetical protein
LGRRGPGAGGGGGGGRSGKLLKNGLGGVWMRLSGSSGEGEVQYVGAIPSRYIPSSLSEDLEVDGMAGHFDKLECESIA